MCIRDSSQRSALETNALRQPPPLFRMDESSAPQLSLWDVYHVLKTCKRTSSGPGEIPYFIYKDYFDVLVPLFHHLWHRSLERGTFPACYKFANLIPIPKIKSAKCTDDIRGISITSILARLFERAVHRKWIAPAIMHHGDPNQFAYKKGLSTVDCLLCFQHFVLSNLDKAEVDGVHAILLDYSKAFDKVNQEKAADNYSHFIQSPHLQKWLYDFTVDRKQRLIWNDVPMPYQAIARGCPQGTVGGPAVFSVLTDDCRASHHTSRLFKYSDDMKCLSLCLKNPSNEEKKTLDKERSNLLSYAKEKELEVNCSKSKEMRFCLNRNPYCDCNHTSGKFETIKEAKVLGITFEVDCSFRSHCQQLLKKLRSCLYLLTYTVIIFQSKLFIWSSRL